MLKVEDINGLKTECNFHQTDRLTYKFAFSDLIKDSQRFGILLVKYSCIRESMHHLISFAVRTLLMAVTILVKSEI